MTKTDRARAGFRGTVKTCVEEATSPGAEYSITSEFGLDGQLVAARTRINGSEQKIAQTMDADVRSEFFYDEQGRKVSIKSFDPETLPRTRTAIGLGVSLWEFALAGHGVPVGGKVKTIHENDQPTELQVLDAEGQTVSRVVRTYDADGRIIEEKPIWENPAPRFIEWLPAEQRDQMTPEQLELMSEEISALLGGQAPAGAFYTYDLQGRITKSCERNMVFERTITTTYNDRGDKAVERTTFTGNCVQPTSFDFPEPSEVRYAYEYDSYGNWTQQTAFSRPDEPSNVRYRKLVYY